MISIPMQVRNVMQDTDRSRGLYCSSVIHNVSDNPDGAVVAETQATSHIVPLFYRQSLLGLLSSTHRTQQLHHDISLTEVFSSCKSYVILYHPSFKFLIHP